MKLKVTYVVETKEGVKELLAATNHMELCPVVSSVVEPLQATPDDFLREQFKNVIGRMDSRLKKLEDKMMTDKEFAASCPPEPPTGEVTVETTYENRAELTDVLDWEDVAVTFAQDYSKDGGYQVEIADNDGIVVKTFVYLHEWSGEVTRYINDQDATGLIKYLIGLNTTTEGKRDGTIIR